MTDTLAPGVLGFRPFTVTVFDNQYQHIEGGRWEDVRAEARAFTYEVLARDPVRMSAQEAERAAQKYAESHHADDDFPDEYDLLIWRAGTPTTAYRVTLKQVSVWESDGGADVFTVPAAPAEQGRA